MDRELGLPSRKNIPILYNEANVYQKPTNQLPPEVPLPEEPPVNQPVDPAPAMERLQGILSYILPRTPGNMAGIVATNAEPNPPELPDVSATWNKIKSFFT